MPYIDGHQLASAFEADLSANPGPDFRTRLLVRDAARALRRFWGAARFGQWLATSPVGDQIRDILRESLGPPGFRYIGRRLVSAVRRAELLQILEMIGKAVRGHVELNIAGSIPTLIEGLTARPTDHIDIVDEVPEPIRRQRALLEKIRSEYGLTFGHVQSHDLPASWKERRHSLGTFGALRAYLVDPYDIFVSKLSSKCEKHVQDRRVLAQALDRDVARQRLFRDGRAFLMDDHLRPRIEENWRFIFQEPLTARPRATPQRPIRRPTKRKPREEP